jgi:hypothetical protein
MNIDIKESRRRLEETLVRHFEDKEKLHEFIEITASELKIKIKKLDPKSDEQQVGNLLEDLIGRGIFPSFSFPLDVAKFEALGTKIKGNDSNTQEHIYASSSQDLKIALSVYSPGKVIVINKQSFKIEGIGMKYPSDPIDRVKDWNLAETRYMDIIDGKKTVNKITLDEDWRYFHRCKAKYCGVIFKTSDPRFNLNGEVSCPNCESQENESDVDSTRMLRPDIFRPIMYTHKNERISKTAPNQQFFPMRANNDEISEKNDNRRNGKASLPHPKGGWGTEDMKEIWTPKKKNEWYGLEVYGFQDNLNKKESTELIIVNEGVNKKGYLICEYCGAIDLSKDKNKGEHDRPYAIDVDRISRLLNTLRLNNKENSEKFKQMLGKSRNKCQGNFVGPFILGHTFRTDLVVFRFKISEPYTTKWDNQWFTSAVISFKEALITETTEALKLQDREIGGSWRKVVLKDDDAGKKEQYIDIFLFDNVSGGAGLVRRICGDEGREEESAEFILNNTWNRLGGNLCEENGCQRVCIRCLLDFRNQIEQDSLNRPLGFQLVNFLKYDSNPDYEVSNIKNFAQRTDDKINILKEILVDSYESNNWIIDIEGRYLNIVNNDKVTKLLPYSILSGISEFPNNSISWKKIKSQSRNILEKSIITIPFEILINSPHILIDIMNPDYGNISSDNINIDDFL